MRLRTIAVLAVCVALLVAAVEVWRANRELLARTQLDLLGMPVPLGTVLGALTGAVFIAALGVLALNAVSNYLRDLGAGHEHRFKENLEIRFLRGLEALLAGRAAEALRTFGEVLDYEPGHPGALLRAGEACRRLGRVEEAIAHHRRLVEGRPDDAEAALALADDCLAAGRRAEARTQLGELARRRPAAEPLRLLRRLLVEDEDWAAALEVHGRLLALKGAPHADDAAHTTMLPYELARAELRAGKPKDAAGRLQKLVNEHPDFTPAHALLGDLAARGETDFETAIERWQEGFAATQQPVFLQRIEDLLIAGGDPEQALAVFRAAAAEYPDHLLVRFFLAKLLFRLELRADAEREFGRLVAQHPDSPTLAYYLGRLAERRGDLRGAAEKYRAVVRGARALDVHYRCAHCGEKRDDWADRCARCKAFNALAVEWRDPEAIQNLPSERPDYLAGMTP